MPLLASFRLFVVVSAGLFSSVGSSGLHDGAPLCLAVVEVKILTDKIKPAPEAQTTGRCRLDSVLLGAQIKMLRLDDALSTSACKSAQSLTALRLVAATLIDRQAACISEGS